MQKTKLVSGFVQITVPDIGFVFFLFLFLFLTLKILRFLATFCPATVLCDRDMFIFLVFF
jgi:hypothetical protein